MPWVLLDVVLALLALAVLAVVALRLYRHVRVLARDVGTAGRTLEELTAALPQVQPPAAPGRSRTSVVVAPSPADRDAGRSAS